MSLLRSLFRPRRPLDLASAEGISQARQTLESGRDETLFAELNQLKAAYRPQRDVDYLRAIYFQHKGQPVAAIQALQEELRYFPDNTDAAALRDKLAAKLPSPPLPEDAEFRKLFTVVAPFTMLSVARLWSLARLGREVCARDLPGNFVECGVAGGGSSALLASIIGADGKRPRRLFACDTFSGMPQADDEDTHRGENADATGWGNGTCAAPVESLLEVCRRLDVGGVVEPIRGLFADTLPVNRARIGEIALLHMDGDWYSSTRDILVNLFDQVVPGGRIQIDDYGYWDGCRRAVTEFAEKRGLAFDLHVIDETGVWFEKK